MRRAFYGKPRLIAADGPVAVTPIERARIEQNIATLLDLLDAIDAPDQDMEEGDDDATNIQLVAQGCYPTDPADDEGTLGWTVDGHLGSNDTLEAGDLERDTADEEHSLGYSSGFSQEGDLRGGLETDGNPDVEDGDPAEDSDGLEPTADDVTHPPSFPTASAAFDQARRQLWALRDRKRGTTARFLAKLDAQA